MGLKQDLLPSSKSRKEYSQQLFNQMVVLKSNLYHLIVKPQSLNKYLIETSPKFVSPTDFQQIIQYFTRFNPHLIGVENGFYIKESWDFKMTHQVMLLKGELVEVNLSLDNSGGNQNQFLEAVLYRMMVNTRFLMCNLLKSCYNPFEEKNMEQNSQIPGFKLALCKQAQTGMFIIPETLVIEKSADSLSGEILIDTTTGKFYKKSDVVKVDKEKELLTFRDKSEIKKKSLKPVHVKQTTGYQLATTLQNYWRRIHSTSSQLIKYWSMSVSQNSQDLQAAFVDPGFISLKGVDKSLNNMIFPVTQNAYNEYYKSNFQGEYEEFPSLEIYVCYKNNQSNKAQILIENIDDIRERMKLNIVTYKAPEWNVSTFIPRADVVYMILTDSSQMNKKQFKEPLVQSEVIFEIVDSKDIEANNKALNQVTVLQHLGIICTKFVKAPWKLKNIPFCNQPLSVISLDIQSSKTQQLSVAITFSFNSLLSKFINVIEVVHEKDLTFAITTIIQNCLIRFQQFHKRFPNRMIMFAPSNSFVPVDLYGELKENLSSFYQLHNKGNIQFIFASHRSCPSLRTFKMATSNLSTHTVTEPGLLAFLVFDNKLCLQLSMNHAMTEFTFYHQSNDPDFLKKISELIVKLAFGSVDNKFGGGLGFLSFANKLNRLKDVDYSKWKEMLWEGHMLYL